MGRYRCDPVKAAQSTASCRVRATRALTCAAAAGSRSRMAWACPVAMDTGSNAARPLGRRYRVQALEAGAQGEQALGGLQPRRNPHPAVDVVHEDRSPAVGRGVEHGRRHARGGRSPVAGHLAQRVSPRSRPLPASAAVILKRPTRVSMRRLKIRTAAAVQRLHAQRRFTPGAPRNAPQDRYGDHPTV